MGISFFLFVTFCAVNVNGLTLKEELALEEFMVTTDISSQISSWNGPIASACTFTGIICNRDNSHIVQLKLSSKNITGTIAPQILYLTELTNFDISFNHFTGPIPDTIGYSNLLTTLFLQNNMLSGPIPLGFENLTSLVVMNISENAGLNGAFPWAVATFYSLRELDIRKNHFYGPFPNLDGLPLVVCNAFGNELCYVEGTQQKCGIRTQCTPDEITTGTTINPTSANPTSANPTSSSSHTTTFPIHSSSGKDQKGKTIAITFGVLVTLLLMISGTVVIVLLRRRRMRLQNDTELGEDTTLLNKPI